MMTLALASFLWWHTIASASLIRTWIVGAVTGAACLTKPMVPAYLAPMTLFFVLRDLFTLLTSKDKKEKHNRRKWLIHDLFAIAVAVVLCIPFYAVGLAVYRRWLATNVASFASIGVHHSFLGNLAAYLGSLPTVMTPVLFGIFLLSFAIFRRTEYCKLLPIILTSLGGLCLTCTSTGTDLEMRYFAPFLVCPAIFSGFLIEKLILSAKPLARVAAVASIVLALGTYVSFNFTPYPIPLSPLPWASGLGRQWNGNPRTQGYADWGYPLVLDTILKIESARPHAPTAIFLSILPNHESLHVSAFTLFLKKQKNYSISATSPRPCTIVGDRVTFDPTTACYADWYLQKTGYTGFQLADRDSVEAYGKLLDFIADSGKYKATLTYHLPDKSDLILYKRISF